MTGKCLRLPTVVLLCLVGVLWINNSLPFRQLSGLMVVAWEAGFAQSIANHSLLYPFATDFGLPTPAPIALGLPAVWPMALVIRMGYTPIDAYAIVNALWLTIAFGGAFTLCRRWGNDFLISGIGAAVWLTLPMVWRHQEGYGALALGFALLPTYLHMSLLFFERPARCDLYYTILYTVIVVVALFMDGYNFVMFAVASSGIACLTLINNGLTKRTLFRLGWHVLSFSLAYVLYKAYVGEMPIKEMPENLFHAMGMDIAFWALPSQGMLWLADALGVSVPRNPRNYWGDNSIWASFYLPLFCTGCWGFWRIRRNRLAVLLLLIAVFALWMSLGPVFKFNDMIPEVISEGWESNIPPAGREGYVPTGNALLCHLPGFETMRAAYRWGGLCALGMWGMMMIALATIKNRVIPLILLLALILLQIPAPKHLAKGYHYRESMLALDREFISACREIIWPEELVAVVPRYNDYLINYAAARAPFLTYNIGGDKNIELASSQWPKTLQKLPIGQFDIFSILWLLQRQEADAVLIPFFPTVGIGWPVSPEKYYDKRDVWMEDINFLVECGQLTVQQSSYFAVVRPTAVFSEELCRQLLLKKNMDAVVFPILPEHRLHVPEIFSQGWHFSEQTQIWSSGSAKLMLPKKVGSSHWRLKFSVFNASQGNPKEVLFIKETGEYCFRTTLTITDEAPHFLDVPFGPGEAPEVLTIEVPKVESPHQCGNSTDTRELGIALYSIETVKDVE